MEIFNLDSNDRKTLSFTIKCAITIHEMADVFDVSPIARRIKILEKMALSKDMLQY